MMNRMVNANNAQGLLDSGTRQSLIFAAAFGVLALAILLLLSLYGLVTGLALDTFKTLAMLDIVGGGFIVGGILLTGLRHSRGQVNRVVTAMLKPVPVEITVNQAPQILPQLPAPALPALPAAEETFKYTRNGVGEGDVPKNLLHGFDPRDLAFLFRHLARGGKWTEAYMEKWELPYSREVMGKAEEGTPYTRFMQVCTDAEIITGRGPKKAGTLAVIEAGEMMTRIKALPEAP